jgi:uncharacterized membrane protein YgcG
MTAVEQMPAVETLSQVTAPMGRMDAGIVALDASIAKTVHCRMRSGRGCSGSFSAGNSSSSGSRKASLKTLCGDFSAEGVR